MFFQNAIFVNQLNFLLFLHEVNKSLNQDPTVAAGQLDTCQLILKVPEIKKLEVIIRNPKFSILTFIYILVLWCVIIYK